jgi:hypothetical protein
VTGIYLEISARQSLRRARIVLKKNCGNKNVLGRKDELDSGLGVGF